MTEEVAPVPVISQSSTGQAGSEGITLYHWYWPIETITLHSGCERETGAV